VLDLRGLASFTDWFFICSATSSRQVQAIVDSIDERLRASGARARIEGDARAEWVLMDYFDFVVHVFVPEKREFFNLERLWGDAPRVAIEDAPAAAAAPAAARRRRQSRARR